MLPKQFYDLRSMLAQLDKQPHEPLCLHAANTHAIGLQCRWVLVILGFYSHARHGVSNDYLNFVDLMQNACADRYSGPLI